MSKDKIEVNLEPFLEETLDSPDTATIESMLLEAFGLLEGELK